MTNIADYCLTYGHEYHPGDTACRACGDPGKRLTPNRTQEFWNAQAEWSQATFGTDHERGPLGALKHLEKEAREAQADITDMVEYADCLFLTLDAARRAGHTLDSLLDTAFAKLAKNKTRVWGKPTSDEPVEHIRGIND